LAFTFEGWFDKGLSLTTWSSTYFFTWRELCGPYSCYKCICVFIYIFVEDSSHNLKASLIYWQFGFEGLVILCHKLQGYQYPHIVLVLSTDDAMHKPNGTSKWMY
jgi:hypothetical protein